MEQFLIGGILVQIDYGPMPVVSEGNLRRFRYDGPWEGDRIRLQCTPEPLSAPADKVILPDNHVYGIYSRNGEPYLIYHWGNMIHGFAVWPDRFAVSLDPGMLRQPPLREDWFFSVCAFHRQLLLRNACILHASYVDIGGEAILFTGRSGIGKSTQADLWVRYADASIINGDRALLRRIDGRWHACGFPTCGTSGICENKTLPLRAIVVLDQSAGNTLQRLSVTEQIRSLVSATEMYPWDAREFDLAISMAMALTAEVPVIRLSCRPDRSAVEVLKNHLEGGASHTSV